MVQVAEDLGKQLNLSPSPRRNTQSPKFIGRRVLKAFALTEHDLQQLNAHRRRVSRNPALGTGATAFVLVQIGSYFQENPQTLYSLGNGLHGIWHNWEAFATIWEFGDYVGFENIWEAIDVTTQVTNYLFDYGMIDLLQGLADAADLATLGTGVAATFAVKKIFYSLNKDQKEKLEELAERMKALIRIAKLAEKAGPPMIIRKEIAKLGRHHFAY